MNPRHVTTRTRQSGVGLIEILVAVLVLSIGFLGMAALQTRALSNNNSAMARSMGTIASYSILDAMRLDPDGVEAGDYDGYGVTVPAAWSQPGDCSGVTTSGGALAQANQEQWCDDLGSLVGPGTQGQITARGGDNYRIIITFNDQRASGGDTDGDATDGQTITTQAKL